MSEELIEQYDWRRCTCAVEEQPCEYCRTRLQLSNDRLNERISRLKRAKTFVETYKLAGLDD